MAAAVFGFFGSIVGLVATVVATAAGITFFIVLWKSGALPDVVGLAGALISGAFGAVTAFFGFLGDLLTFARS
jgi:ABC-type Fe3+-siderophore transport system permease subunit